jgi:TrmH family RNA methyltransferase
MRDEVITSRANPVVKRLRALKERGAEDDLALLEGPKLVEEALAAGLEIVEAAVTPDAAGRARGAAVVRALDARGVPVRRLDDSVLGALSEAETSQGILALARRPVFDEEAFFTGTPLLIVAVGVQDPGNLGALLRTAEAAGATGAYLTDGCADPFAWKALRGSMGSAFRLPHLHGPTAADVLARLRRRGVSTVATASDGDLVYDAVPWQGRVAVLVGSEGSGLPDAIVRAADLRVRIPMAGRVESLNVGVAAGVVLYEAARQRRPPMPGGDPHSE